MIAAETRVGERPRRPGFSVSRVLADHALRLPLTYFTALQLLDILTTVVGVVGGLGELNPITLGVLHRFGLFGLLLQKVPVVIAMVLASALLSRRRAILAAWGLSAVMAVVLISNLALILAGRG